MIMIMIIRVIMMIMMIVYWVFCYIILVTLYKYVAQENIERALKAKNCEQKETLTL